MKLKNILMNILVLITLSVASSCSDTGEFSPCNESAIPITKDQVCLVIEHPNLSPVQEEKIQTELKIGMELINSLMPMDQILIRVVLDPNKVIQEWGMGGFNPSANEVIIAVDANFEALDESLEQNLIPLLAHEIHHAQRRRSVGYGNTLLQAFISEGLADHFAIEVTGVVPPPWSVAMEGEELEAWVDIASETWNNSPYDHSAWFFGNGTIPRWTGYAIGFELVKRYLEENPEETAAGLVGKSAARFEP